ncbi:hypothetical protein [Neobacillus niacini]|uniref:hypothetical protein n=1 Tax=Neobacillus niacini TaxID=86668 RepID=UPI0030000BBF
MTVLIQIHYISNDNKILRKGEFQLRGKSKHMAAYEFWRWIKKEHPYPCDIEKILCDGEDITEKVIEMD